MYLSDDYFFWSHPSCFPPTRLGCIQNYEFTMAQGYFLSRRKDERAVFDYFFRDTPFWWLRAVCWFKGLLELFEKTDLFRRRYLITPVLKVLKPTS